jgi:Spy/CpxP family protein refolding chaperone
MARAPALASFTAAALLLGAAAFAQPGALASSTPEQRAKLQTELMVEKLGLAPDQIPKVEAINLMYAKKMEPVLKGNEGPLVKLRAAKGIDQEKAADLEKVLSKQQYQQYLAAKEEMRQEVERRIAERRAGGAN